MASRVAADVNFTAVPQLQRISLSAGVQEKKQRQLAQVEHASPQSDSQRPRVRKHRRKHVAGAEA